MTNRALKGPFNSEMALQGGATGPGHSSASTALKARLAWLVMESSVVVDVPDDALAVYNVGEPGDAQPRIGAARRRGAAPCRPNRCPGRKESCWAAANLFSLSTLSGLMPMTRVFRSSKSTWEFPNSLVWTVQPGGKGPEEEIDDNVPALMLQEFKLTSRDQGHGKGWRNGADSQHNGPKL